MAPLCVMLVFSFLQPATYGGVIWQYSSDAYIQFLFERDIFDGTLSFSTDYLNIFGRSFIQAVVSTVLCFIIGFPTAYFIVTRPNSQKSFWLFLITVPYWVNLLIRTISLLFVLRDDGPVNTAIIATGIVDQSLPLAFNNFAISLGLIYSYLPFMILPIYASLERFDFDLLDAAYDLYGKYTSVLFHILLPIIRPGIIAGGLLVFIPSLGSFLAPDILGGGKQMMIGNLIAMQFQGSRNWPFGAAVSMVLVTITLLTLLYFSSRAKARSEANMA